MIKLIIIIISLISLTSCSRVDFKSWHFPYHKPVQQGTYLTKGQLQQIKVGDTKDQVQQVLGQPLTTDTFNQNIWRFLYAEFANNNQVKSYQVKIIFKDQLVTNIQVSGQLFNN